jgi:hypothetical protein
MKLTPELEQIGRETRVLSNRVLVKILPYVHPVLATPGIEIQKGVVVAVGPGWRTKRKVEFRSGMDTPIVGPDGRVARFAPSRLSGRTLYFEDGPETGKTLPMSVKPGDVIEFGFRGIELVDFDRIAQFFSLQVGMLAFIRQKAIYSIDPSESLDGCLMWQQSAGYDRNGNFMSGAEDWHRA